MEGAWKYRIGVVADPDTDSKVNGESNLWRSYLKTGHLTVRDDLSSISVSWDSTMVSVAISEASKVCESALSDSHTVLKTMNIIIY